MLLDGKPYTVPYLKALISGSDIYSCQVRGSNLTAPSFFQRLSIIIGRQKVGLFCSLLYIISEKSNQAILPTHFTIAHNFVKSITVNSNHILNQNS